MSIYNKYQSDVDAILSHRHDQGADFWTTPDKRLIKGSPFSAYNSASMLLELGVTPDDPILRQVADLFLSTWKEDGRFKVYPKGGIFPCQTALSLSLLCNMGYYEDERIKKTFNYFLDTPYNDGGWRCNKFYFGKGPTTEYSNPFPTLTILDAFRYTEHLDCNPILDKAVEFLLQHWVIKIPIGPCQYGMGSRFMQVEYPFREYNIFQYVYVLSFYDKAKNDTRFIEAFGVLSNNIQDGQIIVERVVPKLAKLKFCEKNKPSELATLKYNQILFNLGFI